MLVAKNRDTAVDGGFLDRSGGELKLWPDLYLHIRFGNMEGAVWTDNSKIRFKVVVLEAGSGRFVPRMEMSKSEIDAFVQKEGVFYRLPTR
jgi:hypothetical protein